MARPRKLGLDYFPLDVDIFENDKLFDVQIEHGFLGEVIYLRLLCLVYKNGYYYKFDSVDKLSARFIKSIGNRWIGKKKTVNDVIRTIVDVGLFDKQLFQSNVLTSQGIQHRYEKVTGRRQSNRNDYWLIADNAIDNINDVNNAEYVDNNAVNVDNNPINVCSNATNQIKANEIKNNIPIVQSIYPIEYEVIDGQDSVNISEEILFYKEIVFEELDKIKSVYNVILKNMVNEIISKECLRINGNDVSIPNFLNKIIRLIRDVESERHLTEVFTKINEKKGIRNKFSYISSSLYNEAILLETQRLDILN